MRIRRSTAVLVVGAVALALAGVALAVRVRIPHPDGFEQKLKLQAGGDAYFDVYQPPDDYNSGCALGDFPNGEQNDRGFTPANDGQSDGGAVDAFDGGLVLWVRKGSKRSPFEAPHHRGIKKGSKLTVGPAKLRGLQVTRVEQALQNGPILRSLIKLKNPGRHALRRTVIWDSDVGADEAERVRATSSHDTTHRDGDRWLVFADAQGEPSDAPGTLVLYGKGARVTTRVFNPVVDQDSCISFQAKVRVPAHATRYLLFFTEVHNGGDTGLAAAINQAKRYNARSPKGVLKGIDADVKARILNWDLG
jgi:hypothetical protein